MAFLRAGCANLMRRIIVHAANAARYTGSSRLARHMRLRICCNSNGVPEKIWGWANGDAAESATPRPTRPPARRARLHENLTSQRQRRK
jgi:hypothetical protein